jgi:hypothetical protein
MNKNFLTKDISMLMCLHDPLNYSSTSKRISHFLEVTHSEIEHILSTTTYNTLVLTIVWETCDPTYWKDGLWRFLSQLKSLHNKLKVILVFDSWFKPFLLNFSELAEVFYIDFWLYKVYESLIIQKTSRCAEHWDANAQKVLFLTGKPDRLHRTRLLYKLINSELKDCLSWSYKVDAHQLSKVMSFLDNISLSKRNEFLELSYRDLDGYLGSHLGSTGIKFDTTIYSSAVLQIISETDFDRPFSCPFITEKTWLSIANRRPFIVAGELFHLKRLKSFGIRTFEQYLPIPNYDNPDLENFLKYGTLSGKTGDFCHVEQAKQWETFYQNIRDETWPSLVTMDKISSLPKCIQEEIKVKYLPGQYSLGEIRLDAIVENSIFFKKNAKNNAHFVEKDVNHNFKRFLELALQAQESISKLLDEQKLRCKNLYDIFEVFI